jgi:hypothetical protein
VGRWRARSRRRAERARDGAVDGIPVIDAVRTCPSDLDGNGFTGVDDLVTLILAWGPNPGHPADIDGDGIVGVDDLTELIMGWGACS